MDQDELTLMEELRKNGPIHESNIPTSVVNTRGYCTGTVQSLIRRGFATRIVMKGVDGYIALKTIVR